MKRSIALVALFVFSLVSASYAAPRRTTYSDTPATAAPDRVGRWDMGLFADFAFNSDSDSTGFYGGTVAYGVTPWIALGVSAGWQEAEVDTDSDQDLGLVPIMADIIVRFPNVHATVVPYGVLGLGVIGAYVTDENGVGPTNNGDDSDDTAFGWKIGAGVDWFLNERWIMNFELAYYSADPDLTNTQVSDIDFWTLGAGIKYLY